MRNNSRGFTLMEVMVVFGIMVLVMAVVPMAFSRFHDAAQYRSTLRHVLSDMRSARNMALAQGREVRFSVNLNGATFGVEGRQERHLPESVAVQATVADIEMRDGVASIRFLPQGGATGGSIDVIRVSNGYGTRLRTDWLSGQITQEPLQP